MPARRLRGGCPYERPWRVEPNNGSTMEAWQGQVACSDHIECVLLSPCGKYVCLGSAGGEIVVVSLETGSRVADLGSHDGGTLCMCPTRDGLIVSGGEDSYVRVHSLERMAEVGRLRVDGGQGVNCSTGTWVTAVASEKDGTHVAAAAGNVITVADWASGAFDSDGGVHSGDVTVIGPTDRAIDCLAFLSDGRLASCGYGGVSLWTRDDHHGYELVPRMSKTYHEGTAQCTLGYKGWLLSLAPSPGSDWIAAGCNDNTLRLWRVSNGQDFKCGGIPRPAAGHGLRQRWQSPSRDAHARHRLFVQGHLHPLGPSRAVVREHGIKPGDALGLLQWQPRGHLTSCLRRPSNIRPCHRVPPNRTVLCVG